MKHALPILTYHSIDHSGSVISVAPELFARHMACIAELGFTGVSLAEALELRDRAGRWPERTVAITFDDGYQNNHSRARPVLAAHGFTATVYLVTAHVGADNGWEPPPPRLGVRATMDWTQAAELASAGWEIGSHSRSHPDLRRLSEPQLASELEGSRSDIEQRLGRCPATFAYPYGLSSPAARALAGKTYRGACTTRLARARSEPLEALSRVDMYYLRDGASLRRLLTGRLDGYLALRRAGRWLRSLAR